MEAREAAMPGTRPGAAARERRHRGRKRDVFSGVSMAVATVVLLFVGSAIVAIVAGGIAHFGEAVTSAEVLFSLRMSVVTSSISTVLCLVLALPTAYALSRTNMPFKRVAEVLMELTLSLPYILLGFALLLIFSSAVRQGPQRGRARGGVRTGRYRVRPAHREPPVRHPHGAHGVRRREPAHGVRGEDARSARPATCSAPVILPQCAQRAHHARSSSPGRAAWASSAPRSCWWA